MDRAVCRYQTNGDKLIVMIVIFAMTILCTFSHQSSPKWQTDTTISDTWSTTSMLTGGFSKRVDGSKILESRLTATVKAAEEVTRSRQTGRNSRVVLDTALSFQLKQAGSMSAYIPFILVRSELTPRYSVIAYLHLSDGEKSSGVLS